jgi:hypothetical protein
VTNKTDLQEIKENMKKTVETCDLKGPVTNIVKELLADFQREYGK